MKKSIYYILILFLIGQLVACTTKKNTWASRSYHALNSRYNIYFNGKASFDEALSVMSDEYVDNYSRMIHLHPVSGLSKVKETPGGPFDRSIEKGEKAIGLHAIHVKPSRKRGWRNDPKQVANQAKEEYNPFLKHCWMLIGKSQFYNGDFLEASSTFAFLTRHYRTEPDVVLEARLWRARCYAELGWLYDAEQAFKRMKEERLAGGVLTDFNRFYADYLLKRDSLSLAMPYLQQVIKDEKNKKQKLRLKYLLGQVFLSLGRKAEARQAFDAVSRSLYVPDDLGFAARIRQADAVVPGQEQQLLKRLSKMEKSERYSDWLDQLYRAKGEVYLSMNDTVNAIASYRLGVEKGTGKGFEQVDCMVRLGNLYLETKDYMKAQPCFTKALSIVEKDYVDYQHIASLSVVLDAWVVHAETIHLQDSLQRVAALPEAERMALIDGMIKTLIKQEKEEEKLMEKEAYLAEQDASLGIQERTGSGLTEGLSVKSENSFYFYNPSLVAQGKVYFQNRWGRRPLEDDWRRRDKAIRAFDMNEENYLIEPVDVGENKQESSDLTASDSIHKIDSLALNPHNPTYYLSQLPLTVEEVESSNRLIENALFRMGVLYKDRLEDYPMAIQTFDELDRRFPDNPYRLDYYYQTYLMALHRNNEGLMQTIKRKLEQSYPDAAYTQAVQSPTFEQDLRQLDKNQESLYQQTYASYLSGDTAQLRKNYHLFIKQYPLGTLMPKMMLLNALTYAQAGDQDNFKTALKALIENYSGEDVTALATEMMKGMLAGKQLLEGRMERMVWNVRLGNERVSLSTESLPAFSDSVGGKHQVLLIYPSDSFDRNLLLFTVAAFNFSNLQTKSPDLVFEEASSLTILKITGFDGLKEALHYYRLIYGEEGYAKKWESAFTAFPISEANYRVLSGGMTLEAYEQFYEQHFESLEPQVVSRWKAQMDVSVEEEISASEIPAVEVIEEIHTPVDLSREVPTQQADSSLVLPIDTVQPENTQDAISKYIEERRRQLESEELSVEQPAGEQSEVKEKEERGKREELNKSRSEQLKQYERERKEKIKAVERERKEKEKARKEALKAKEKARKTQLKEREKERKRSLREIEKARKASSKKH